MLKKVGTLFAAFMLSSCGQDGVSQEEHKPAPVPSSPQAKNSANEPSAISEMSKIMSGKPVGSHVLVASSMRDGDEGKVMVLTVKVDQQIEHNVIKLQGNWQKINHICEKFAFVPVIPDEKGKLSALYGGTGQHFYLHQLVEINPEKVGDIRRKVDESGVPLLLKYKEGVHCRLALQPTHS